MEGKDDKQIHKVLASPPSNLYDMIFSVFDRLSRDPEIDSEVVNKLLAWVAFARRPLSFGELDVILRSESEATNWFLWSHIRGKFASIMRLRYPKGWDPDVEDRETQEKSSDEAAATSGAQTEPDVVDDDFDLDDFSDEEDEDDETKSIASNEVTSEEEDETATQTTWKYEPPRISDADQLYNWYQKHTTVDFSHQRFRDFLVLEGNPRKRQKPVLSIRIDVESVQVQIVNDCFKALRGGLSNRMFHF